MITVEAEIGTPRWQNYILESGAGLSHLWTAHLASSARDVLFVLGKGFDPRMCAGVEMLLNIDGNGTRDVLAIVFDEGATSPSVAYSSIVNENWDKLRGLIGGKGKLSERSISMWSEDRRRIGSRSAANIFNSISDIEGYSDIIRTFSIG